MPKSAAAATMRSATDHDSRVDGRSARALKTREAIVDACIGLVEEGELRPTAPRVAERAGVSVRSVFQHFADLPALHIAVAERIAERVSALLDPVDPEVSFDVRVETFVRSRVALLEAVTPYRRAANVHGPFAPEIRRAVDRSTACLRDQVSRTFAPELDAVADWTVRREGLEGLVMALSWSAWDALRADGNRTVAEATAVTGRVVRAILADLAASSGECRLGLG